MMNCAANLRPRVASSNLSRPNQRIAPFQQAQRRVAFVPSKRSAVGACQAGKLISRTEVPAFIQRDDMMDQIVRWANIEAGENGHRNFGLPMTIERLLKDDVLNGIKISILKEGNKLTDIVIEFDAEVTHKYDWININPEDMSVEPEGEAKEVGGKNIEIKKIDDNPVDDDLRSAIRGLCNSFAIACNKYYAFGSVFSEEL